MATSRKPANAYQKRNERAQAEGFKNYYDKRTKEAMARNLTLSQARGHARQFSFMDEGSSGGLFGDSEREAGVFEPTARDIRTGTVSEATFLNFKVWAYANDEDLADIAQEWMDAWDIDFTHDQWSEMLGSPPLK